MSKLKVNKEEVLLNINKVFNLTNKLNNPNLKEEEINKIVKDYKRLRDLINTDLDMYKSFESPENKEIAKNRLKKLTPEFQAAKKAYEKLKGVKL